MSRDYDDGLEDDYDDRPRRRGRRGGTVEEGKRLVAGPATFLIIMGVINLLMVGMGVINLMTWDEQFDDEVAKVQANPQLTDDQKQEQTALMRKIGDTTKPFIAPSIGIQVITALLILFGGIKMKNLSSRGFAMTSAIIVMIPCITGCCFIGVGAGIWALIALSKPEVKAAFRAKSNSINNDALDNYDE